jgi:hypothetical protein
MRSRLRRGGAALTGAVPALVLALACGGGGDGVPSGWTAYEGDGYRAATAPGWELLRFRTAEVAQLAALDAAVPDLGGVAVELMQALAASSTPAGSSGAGMVRVERMDVVVFGDRLSAPPLALVARPCLPASRVGAAKVMPAGFTASDPIMLDGVEASQLVREARGGLVVLVLRAVGDCIDVLMFISARPERRADRADFERFLGTMRFER